MTFTERWWASVVNAAAEAFAQAVARGDFDVAGKWSEVVLGHLDQDREEADHA
jgi:hypothetical protein